MAATTFKPPALELFRQQSSLGKIGKEEPWTLEIISYWSDKLSSILDYFTFDPQKKVFYQFSAKVRCYLFITSSNPRASPSPRVPAFPRSRFPTYPCPRLPASPRPTPPRPRVPASHVPTSPRPTSHVPVPLLVTAIKIAMSCNLLLCKVGNIALCNFVYLSQGVCVICLAPVSLLSKRVGLYVFARTKLFNNLTMLLLAVRGTSTLTNNNNNNKNKNKTF